ncbi:hypothetical protein [Terrisporobacter petrolearius]|uniref:hypothetical protein n=1 Tax=Terrisporobacter petrolearius TaxID=1460447 RepID=UPI0031CCC332
MSRVVLTFKNNEKEKKIEEFLEQKVSASAYLKELVWDVINGNIVSENGINNVVISKEENKEEKKIPKA